MAKSGHCSVPSTDYPTIQSAINDAKCEIISVAAGMYRENLVITRSLTLQGAGDSSTIIDGGREGVVIRISDGAAPVIEGLTISGGNGTANGGKGGGIFIQGATATIRNNVISDNVASMDVNTFGWGGGIYIESGTEPVRIEANTIQSNVAFSVPMHVTVIEGKGGGNGGGIAIGAGASAEISGNTIRGNGGFTRGDDTGFPYLGLTWGGGGIYTQGDVTNIEGNTIQDNFGGLAGNTGHAGAINIAAGAVTITNNVITRNTALVSGAFGQGGAINATAQFQTVTIIGNRIEENTGVINGHSPMPNSFISSGGGGIHIFGRVAPPDNSVTIRDNHLIGNVLARSIVGAGGQGAIVGGGGGATYVARCNAVVFSNNEVRGNIGVQNISLSGAGAFGGAQGGGIVMQANQSVTVSDNEVRDNVTCERLVNVGSIASNDGGGISIWRTPHATITNNIVTGNKGVETAFFVANDQFGIYLARGGGIYVNDVELPDFDGPPNFDDSVVLKGNSVTNNVAIETLNVLGGSAQGIVLGGGIFVGNITTAEIIDNEVRDNVNAKLQMVNTMSADADIALYHVGSANVKGNTTQGNKLYATPRECLARSIPAINETYRFKVGSIECIAVSDGCLPYIAPAGFLFGNAPQDALDKALTEHNFPREMWVGTYTCLLINTGKSRVLVDTGPGPAAPSTGRLIQNLRGEGIEPGDIDTVIITHAHPDHIGGNVDSGGKPNFPNARYVMLKAEWDFWTKEPDLAELQAPDFLKGSLLEFTASQLPLIEAKLELVESEAEVAPGVSVIHAPGHTPGQIAVKVASDGDQLLYISDLVLHPIHFEHIDWLSIMDLGADQTAASRRRILDQAAAEGALVLGFHFAFPALGRVIKKGEAWSWQPL